MMRRRRSGERQGQHETWNQTDGPEAAAVHRGRAVLLACVV